MMMTSIAMKENSNTGKIGQRLWTTLMRAVMEEISSNSKIKDTDYIEKCRESKVKERVSKGLLDTRPSTYGLSLEATA